MNDFYVYIHRKATTKEIFYVGKGQGKRAYSISKRNKFWKNTVKKHGFFVEFVEKGLQEWAAFEIEQGLIAFYGRKDTKDGILVNLSDGGEGSTGHIWSNELKEWRSAKTIEQMKSEEHRKVLSEKKKGIKLSAETRQKMSYSVTLLWEQDKVKKEQAKNRMKERWINNQEFRERMVEMSRTLKHTEESKQKIAKAHSKQVKRSDGMLFSSVAEAAKFMQKNHSKICLAANKKRQTAYGYSWEYV